MKIQLGIVAKPQGVKGEIKVNSPADTALRFLNLKKVYIGGVEYAVVRCDVRDKGVYLTVAGISDRNAVEPLRGLAVEADKADLGELDADEYYVEDLIGCNIVCDGVTLGVLEDVQNYGSADIFCSHFEGKPVMFPFIGEVVTDVDVDARIVSVSQEGLAAHSVYED